MYKRSPGIPAFNNISFRRRFKAMKNGIKADFVENETGSIEVGKKADLVVLDRNLFDIPETEIADTNVLLTLFEGKPIYRDAAL